MKMLIVNKQKNLIKLESFNAVSRTTTENNYRICNYEHRRTVTHNLGGTKPQTISGALKIFENKIKKFKIFNKN